MSLTSVAQTNAAHIGRVLITGAARGLGLETSQRLSNLGWEVWAVDLGEVPQESHAHFRTSLDITDQDAVHGLFVAINAAGGLDALVNNAGIFPLAPWDELDLDTWRKTIDVNLTGSFICARAAAASMRDHGRQGSIVNVASTAFYKGHATGLAYSASKGGVVGLTRTLAAAVGGFGVRVNAVAPGMMPTPGVRELIAEGTLPGDRLAHDSQRVLAGQTTTAGVAAVIEFLVSNAAKEITGQVIAADGGTTFI